MRGIRTSVAAYFYAANQLFLLELLRSRHIQSRQRSATLVRRQGLEAPPLPPMQHRRLMEFLSPNSFDSVAPVMPVNSPLEALGLSVRTRNALKSVGCATVDDILRLDIQAPI